MNRRLMIPLTIRPARAPAKPLRRGYTLIEVMLVVTIVLTVTAAGVPMWNHAADLRQIREGARGVAAILGAARTRAITTGRPVGVWIEPLSDVNATPANPTKMGASQAVYFCEYPPSYFGDALNATIAVPTGGHKIENQPANNPSTGPLTAVAKIKFLTGGAATDLTALTASLKQLGILDNTNPATARIPANTYFYIRIGNGVYRLENQLVGGTVAFFNPTTGLATVSNPANPTGNFLVPGDSVQLPPINNTGVPFEIIRAPVKSPDPPLQLPGSACIDITQSGYALLTGANSEADRTFMQDKNGNFTSTPPQSPVLLWFGPSGKLQYLYYSNNATILKPSGPIYFLVGRRDWVGGRYYPPLPSKPGAITAADPNDDNLTSLTSSWVAISAQSGLITTADNKDTSSVSDLTRRNSEARSNARGVLSSGGVQ